MLCWHRSRSDLWMKTAKLALDVPCWGLPPCGAGRRRSNSTSGLYLCENPALLTTLQREGGTTGRRPLNRCVSSVSVASPNRGGKWKWTERAMPPRTGPLLPGFWWFAPVPCALAGCRLLVASSYLFFSNLSAELLLLDCGSGSASFQVSLVRFSHMATVKCAFKKKQKKNSASQNLYRNIATFFFF